MGSGKSTVAKKLSKLMGWEYIDLDSLIENNNACSISRIFEKEGEAGFRKIEAETLRTLTIHKDLIVSCGGGTPCYYKNMDWMNSNGYTVYIELSIAALKSRLVNARTSRPLISNYSDSELEAYISNTMSEREKYYLQAKERIKGLDINITQLSDHLESLNPYNP